MKTYNSTYLMKRYILFNSIYFNNKLQKKIDIEISDKLKSKVGLCYFYMVGDRIISVQKIVISKWLIENYPEEVDNVLLHEMVHIIVGLTKHNKEIQTQMNLLNSLYGRDIKLKFAV